VSFQIGDKVIYPNHGLGVVEKVEEKTILGTTTGFFHLRIISNETTVLVPVANVDNVGLRRAITDEEVERLFQLLGDGNIDNHQNWKGRFKDNSDKMRTGSIYDMADVLKSLTFLAKSKSLSFREKRMLDRAKSLIVSEISEVMRLTAASIEDRVNEALEKCFATKAAAPKQAPVKITPPAPPVYAPAPVPVAAVASKPVAAVPKPAAAKPVAAPKAVAAAAKPAIAKKSASTAKAPVAKAASKPKPVASKSVSTKAVARKAGAKPTAKLSARAVSKPARQARAS
jgi:CarD family transcriptional regulator